MGLTSKANRDWLAFRKALHKCNRQYKAIQKKYKRHRNIFQKLFGYCPQCERYFRWPVKAKRKNTCFANEVQNWITACDECHYAYVAEFWSRHYLDYCLKRMREEK